MRVVDEQHGLSRFDVAHLDTVGVQAMEAPFDARVEDGRLYGRGSYDMKGALAAAMLAVGRDRAGGLPIEFREGDMRELELDEPVDLVICPFRALLHLPNWADRRRTFERVAAALRPGGRFAFNVFAFSGEVAARLNGVRQDRADSWEIPHYVWADSRIDITRGRGDEESGLLHLWWIGRTEFEGLIDVAGLEVEALYGWFDKRPYDDSALEMVWVARKP